MKEIEEFYEWAFKSTTNIEKLNKKYKELALKYHPDKNHNHPTSIDIFKKLLNIYQNATEFKKDERDKLNINKWIQDEITIREWIESYENFQDRLEKIKFFLFKYYDQNQIQAFNEDYDLYLHEQSLIKKFKSELDEINKEKDKFEQEKNQLQSKLDEINKEKELNIEEKNQLQSKLDEINKEKELNIEEKNQLQSKLDEINKEKDKFEQEKNQLQSKLDEINKEKDKFEQEKNQIADNEITTSEEEIDFELSKSKRKLEKRKELKSVKEQLKEYKEAIEKIKESNQSQEPQPGPSSGCRYANDPREAESYILTQNLQEKELNIEEEIEVYSQESSIDEEIEVYSQESSIDEEIEVYSQESSIDEEIEVYSQESSIDEEIEVYSQESSIDEDIYKIVDQWIENKIVFETLKRNIKSFPTKIDFIKKYLKTKNNSKNLIKRFDEEQQKSKEKDREYQRRKSITEDEDIYKIVDQWIENKIVFETLKKNIKSFPTKIDFIKKYLKTKNNSKNLIKRFDEEQQKSKEKNHKNYKIKLITEDEDIYKIVDQWIENKIVFNTFKQSIKSFATKIDFIKKYLKTKNNSKNLIKRFDEEQEKSKEKYHKNYKIKLITEDEDIYKIVDQWIENKIVFNTFKQSIKSFATKIDFIKKYLKTKNNSKNLIKRFDEEQEKSKEKDRKYPRKKSITEDEDIYKIVDQWIENKIVFETFKQSIKSFPTKIDFIKKYLKTKNNSKNLIKRFDEEQEKSKEKEREYRRRKSITEDEDIYKIADQWIENKIVFETLKKNIKSFATKIDFIKKYLKTKNNSKNLIKRFDEEQEKSKEKDRKYPRKKSITEDEDIYKLKGGGTDFLPTDKLLDDHHQYHKIDEIKTDDNFDKDGDSKLLETINNICIVNCSNEYIEKKEEKNRNQKIKIVSLLFNRIRKYFLNRSLRQKENKQIRRKTEELIQKNIKHNLEILRRQSILEQNKKPTVNLCNNKKHLKILIELVEKERRWGNMCLTKNAKERIKNLFFEKTNLDIRSNLKIIDNTILQIQKNINEKLQINSLLKERENYERYKIKCLIQNQFWKQDSENNIIDYDESSSLLGFIKCQINNTTSSQAHDVNHPQPSSNESVTVRLREESNKITLKNSNDFAYRNENYSLQKDIKKIINSSKLLIDSSIKTRQIISERIETLNQLSNYNNTASKKSYNTSLEVHDVNHPQPSSNESVTVRLREESNKITLKNSNDFAYRNENYSLQKDIKKIINSSKLLIDSSIKTRQIISERIETLNQLSNYNNTASKKSYNTSLEVPDVPTYEPWNKASTSTVRELEPCLKEKNEFKVWNGNTF